MQNLAVGQTSRSVRYFGTCFVTTSTRFEPLTGHSNLSDLPPRALGMCPFAGQGSYMQFGFARSVADNRQRTGTGFGGSRDGCRLFAVSDLTSPH